jgi:D-aspartate ligase
MAGAEAAPALVVGSDLNALGVVRSLAAGGVRAHVLGPADGVAMRSRYARRHALDDTGGAALTRALLQLAPAIGGGRRPVLFLTEEKAVRAVSQQRAELLPHFRIALPEADALDALMDKNAFQALAQALGGAIPRAVGLSCEADLARLAGLRYPAVLKPAYKHYGYGALFQKAYVVLSAAEAAQRWRAIAPVLADLIVQEWIAGDDSAIYFCLQYVGAGGATVASFTGRKLRSWPPRVGGTASCIAAPEHAAELAASTAAFFRAAGFVGMGSMEYKRDERDGRFYMIEPTVARSDFQEEVATLNGTNIALAAYRHETGGAPPPCPAAQPPRLWREPLTDRWARALAATAPPEADIAHVACDAYFRLADPMPWLAYLGERAAARARLLWRRLRPGAAAAPGERP